MRTEKTFEVEARFINLDRAAIEEKLETLGAEKQREAFFREWLLYLVPEWDKERRRVRVRTDGTNHWLTYKANPTWEVDSAEEIECTVSSPEEARRLIEAIGIPLRRYQEKKRISYALGDIIFELDFWPKIPMVLEIEAPTKEQVMEGARLLGLNWKDAIFVDQKVLHQQYYGIDLSQVSDYTF